MPDTPQPFEPPETPVERSGGNDAPTNDAPTNDAPTNGDATNGDGTSLKDRYDDYLVRCDMALRDGEPLPPLPAELTATPFAPQAASGVRLLKLLARARDTVMGTPAPELGSAPLERVGPFRLVRELGRGGHGVVYLAVDERLGRQVALKLSRPETLLDADLRKRFLREAQAAGQLDHPQLVPVHEVGEEGRLFYIASQYVEGKDLAQWLAEQTAPVPPRQAAELVAALADGVEHAHAHGILHRDIKPSNVLLSEEGGRLSPRLTDFGLAKLLEATKDQTQTRTGVLLGTPTYMAPELATGKLREVGPATDVYGLGALLYEILTGRPPFRGENDVDTIYHTVHSEPLDPRRLRPGVSPELAAICLKCLEKRPDARYAAADELAGDLRRYLRGQPTLARPATPLRRTWKWARRRPTVAGLSAALVAAALVLMCGGLWYNGRLQSLALDLASSNAELAAANQRKEGEAWSATAGAVYSHLQSGNTEQARLVLDRELLTRAKPPTEFYFRWLRKLVGAEDFRTRHAASAVMALAVSHDGAWFATGGADGMVRLYRTSDGSLLKEFPFPQKVPIYSLAFSMRDDLIVSGGGNLERSEVHIWTVPEGVRIADLEGPPATVNSVAFSPDGRRIAAAGAGPGEAGAVCEVRLWDFEFPPRVIPRTHLGFSVSPPRVWRAPHWQVASSLAFAGDSQNVAVGYSGANATGAVGLWSVESGTEAKLLPAKTTVWSVAFADHDRRLLAGDLQGGLTLWDFPKCAELGRYTVRNEARVMGMAPSPEGRYVYVSTFANQPGPTAAEVTQWSVAGEPQLVAMLNSGPHEVRALAPLGDGRSLLRGGADGLVLRWNIEEKTLWTQLPANSLLSTVSFSPTGKLLAAQHVDGLVRIHQLADRTSTSLSHAHGAEAKCMTFGRTDRELFTSGQDGLVCLHDLSSPSSNSKIVARHGSHLRREQQGPRDREVRALAFCPTRGYLASGANDRRVQVWDMERVETVFESPDQADWVRGVDISPDGEFVAGVSGNGWARVWRISDGKLQYEEFHGDDLWSVAWSPSGDQLAIGGESGKVWIRGFSAGGRLLHELQLGDAAWSLDYAPQGRCLAAGSRDGRVSLWDPLSGLPVLDLPRPAGTPLEVRFSADGSQLAAAFMDGTITLWQVDPTPVSDPLPQNPVLRAVQQRPREMPSSAAYAVRVRALQRDLERVDLRKVGIGVQQLVQEVGGAETPFELRYLRQVSNRDSQTFEAFGESATCLTLSRECNIAYVGTASGDLTIVPLTDGPGQRLSVGAPIRSIALGPSDSKLFVLTGQGARLLDLSSGEVRNVGRAWNGIATSPDGQTLVAGDDPQPNGAPIHRFDAMHDLQELPLWTVASRNEHQESAIPIQNFVFSRSGKTLAVGHGNSAIRGSTGMVTFWDWERGIEAPARFTGFEDYVQSMAFSPDDSILAAGCLDGTLRLWDVPGQRPIATLRSDAGPINRVAFSPDGRFVATGSAYPAGKTSQVLLWDVANRGLAGCLARLPYAVVGLEFLPDGDSLAVLTEDRLIRLMRWEEGMLFERINAHEGQVNVWEFGTDSRLFTAGNDLSMRVWDLPSRTPAATLGPLEESVRGLVVPGEGRPWLTVGAGCNLVWRDPATGKPTRSRTMGSEELTAVAESASGAVAAIDAGGKIHWWNPADNLERSWSPPWGPARFPVFNEPTGKLLTTASADKVVHWDARYRNYREVRDAGGTVSSLALSPDRKWAAAGTDQGLIRVWLLAEEEPRATIQGHRGPVTALAFSADGRTLASASMPGEVRLWGAPNLEELLVLRAPHVPIGALRFSPNGRRLVAGLADGAMVFWSTK